MKELCVPVPHFQEKENAELVLKVGKERISFSFRVVSFPWDVEDEFSNGKDEVSRSLARIRKPDLFRYCTDRRKRHNQFEGIHQTIYNEEKVTGIEFIFCYYPAFYIERPGKQMVIG